MNTKEVKEAALKHSTHIWDGVKPWKQINQTKLNSFLEGAKFYKELIEKQDKI